MQAFHGKQPFLCPLLSYNEKRALPQSSLYLAAGGHNALYPTLQKILKTLYPKENVHWTLNPNFPAIDTYILFYVCSYDVKEAPLLVEAIHRAQSLLKSGRLKSEAHILIILYRDLRVAFPERKLQREKSMSDMVTQEILFREAPLEQQRIQVAHEFGVHNLQDSLQQLTGYAFYFELMH